MPFFIHPSTGELWEFDPQSEDELEKLRREGFQAASDLDVQRHDARVREQRAIRAADEGGFSLGATGEAIHRAGAGVAAALAPAAEAIFPGLANSPGVRREQGRPPTAEEMAPEAFSEEARLRAKAHPFSAGVGTGIAAAPLAVPAGMLGAGAAGAAGLGAVGGAAGAALGEAAVEAAAQEYDDAWLEQRPFDLQNAAAYTGMFALGDLVLRGLGAGVARAFKKPGRDPLARNVVAESNAELRERLPAGGVPLSSAGAAARASDLDGPYTSALKDMSDRDAFILDRDANDYLGAIALDGTDALNRLRRGLDEDLGTVVKYEDFEQGAAGWGESHRSAQEMFFGELGERLNPAIAAFRRSAPGDISFGNPGKSAANLMERYLRDAPDAIGTPRFNLLTDELKKGLDKQMMRMDGSFSVDNLTKDEFKNVLRPLLGQRVGNKLTKGWLREALENPVIFGENARLQKALNPGWHELLKHWGLVQRQFYELTGETLYDHSGAGRRVQEASFSKLLNVLGQRNVDKHQLGQHLSGAFDGLTDLIEARRQFGIVRRDNLDNLLNDLASLKEDWNLAATVGRARSKMEIAKRNPQNYQRLVREVLEAAPGGGMVGRIGGLVGAVSDAQQGTRLTKGTPLAEVWDRGLERLGKHPAFQAPEIAGDFSDWFKGALREHGGRVAAVGGLGALGAMADDEQTGGALAAAGGLGLFAGKLGRSGARRTMARAARKNLPEAAEAAARGELAPLEARAALKRGLREPVEGDAGGVVRAGEELLDPQNVVPTPRAAQNLPSEVTRALPTGTQIADDVLTPHVGRIPYLEERITGPGGKTPGGFFRGADGKIRYVKVDKDPAHDVVEAGNASMYRSLGIRAPELEVLKLPDGKTALASEWLGPGWKELDKVEDWSTLPRSVREQYAKQTTVDMLLGNWDVSRNAKNVMTDGESIAMIDAGEAGANAWAAKWYAGDEAHTIREGRRLRAATQKEIPGADTEAFLLDERFGVVVGKDTPLRILDPIPREELQRLAKQGLVEAVEKIRAAGGAKEFIRKHHPTMGPEELERAAKEMGLRSRAIGEMLPLLGGLLYVAFSPSDAKASETRPRAEEPATPEVAYRQAIKENARGGAALVQSVGAHLARGKPLGRVPKSLPPLQELAGTTSPERAYERARDRLADLAEDPTALVDELAGATGDLSQTHPSVYQALVGRAAQLLTYLAETLPRPSGRSLARPDGIPVSRTILEDWANQVLGATRPQATLVRMTRDRLPAERLEAFARNWPELWEQTRASTAGTVARMAEEGSRIPPERLAYLDRTLGFGGALDPTQSSKFAATMLQAIEAQEAEQAQQTGGGGNSSGGGSQSTRLQTRMGSIRAERQLSG